MSNLYLISGSDEFSVRQKVGELIVALCGDKPEENPCLEIIHGDSKDDSPDKMINEMTLSIQTPDLFGGNKAIWLKRFDFLQVSKNKKLKAAVDKFIEALKAGIPQDIILILDGLNIDKRSALYKMCQKTGDVHIFDKVDVKSRDWIEDIRIRIRKKCQEIQMRINPDAEQFLAETSGVDTGRVLSELDKLSSFISPRTQVTLEDCQAICSITPEVAGWAYADALAAKDLKKALRTLHILFNSKEYGKSVIYFVVNRFQEMIGIKTAAAQLSLGSDVKYPRFKNAVQNIHPALKEKLKGRLILKANPYRSFMLYSQAVNFTDAKLANALSAILAVNRDMVSSGSDPEIALELLAIKICS